VLVVSEVCAGGCGARMVGEGLTRGEERIVGRSTDHAAVGVATVKAIPLVSLSKLFMHGIATPSAFRFDMMIDDHRGSP